MINERIYLLKEQLKAAVDKADHFESLNKILHELKFSDGTEISLEKIDAEVLIL
jgi:hypothetical protein